MNFHFGRADSVREGNVLRGSRRTERLVFAASCKLLQAIAELRILRAALQSFAVHRFRFVVASLILKDAPDCGDAIRVTAILPMYGA